jgi:hypothetical protein
MIDAVFPNGNVIQILQVPSIHSRHPRRAEKGGLHVNILYVPKYIFARENTAPNRPSSENEPPKAIIDDVLIIELVKNSSSKVPQPNPSCPAPVHMQKRLHNV